jgi:hypothetical protein
MLLEPVVEIVEVFFLPASEYVAVMKSGNCILLEIERLSFVLWDVNELEDSVEWLMIDRSDPLA